MLYNAQIAESQLHSPHYLKSVTELGDDQPIVTSQKIYSSRGVKLLNGGVPVNSTVYEHLLHHKLIPKLDECLTTGDMVTNQVLVDDASYLMAFDKRLQMMRAAMPDDSLITDALAKIPLNPGTAFKLTVMRNKRQDLFHHSIYVSIVTIYIGIQAGLRGHSLIQLATAAVLHDIGFLHMDPALLSRGYHMTETERHHLYAHPLTAWMMLKEYGEYSDAVLSAILQHHERLDGSGYPMGLVGEGIGQFGQMIAVAEIVASSYNTEDTQYDGLKLETILKLNSRRYGQHLIGHLKVFYQETVEVPTTTEEEKQLVRQHLVAIATVWAGWESMREKCNHNHLFDFVDSQMQCLKLEALEAGLDLNSVEKNLLGIEDDPRACAEARILLDELIWQIHNIVHEIRRRWSDIDCSNPTGDLQPVCEWIGNTESLLNPS